MPDDLTFRRLPLLPLSGLVLLVLAAFAAILVGWSQGNANDRVIHTMGIELRINQARETVRAVESAHRGFLIAGNTALLGDLRRAEAKLESEIDELQRETIDNPRQQVNIGDLRARVADKIAFAERAVTLTRAGQRDVAIDLVDLGHGRVLMHAVGAVLDRMKAEEESLLRARIRQVNILFTLLLVADMLAIMLVLVIAAATVRDARIRFKEAEAARDEARGAAEVIRQEMAAREAAEGQLRQMQKMESIGQLTGGIAHDFNNMLAIVIGSLDLARRRAGSGDTARLERHIDNAREGAERAAALTARLLAFSRQQPLAPVVIDANKLVSGMSELLRRTLGEQIAVETVLAGGLWRTYADVPQLENALINLAVNARDAMQGEETARLTIETGNAYLDDEYARGRNEVTPGQYVLISLSDTGTGMSPETIERAFDPFFTTKEVGKGTGLGLSQVFGFVKQSGGHIAIYSELGEGTTVKLYLPRFAGPAAEGPDPGHLTGSLPEGRSDEIILVVEDEQRVRHFSVDALRELGYTAISAQNGREALAILQEQPSIALLFTDIVMPEMNGRRLSDEARAIRPTLKVLYTTGYTRNAVVHNGMLDAGVAFLPKPFTIAQLAIKVREVLDGGGINRPV